MTERLRTVRLYGRLGARFGRKFQLAVNSPAEAIFALGILLPGFRQFLTGCKDQGIEFAVFIGRENLSKAQLHDPPGADDIRIAPVLVGSKRGGALQTIVGVALIVVAYIYGGPGAGAAATKFWGAVGAAGWSLAIGGVVQMLSPQPRGLGAKESAENAPNYSMNGPVNVQAQSNPVPVAYGGHDTKGMIVGSVVISGGIYAEDQQ
ncbi:tail assembly protein [Stenotrophomonas maltophilia]|nr:tail assembly protein [Stenotrophomonas maltophilia]HDS1566358.1 tail assembly protein [Stenotrophomonas maltophilia]